MAPYSHLESEVGDIGQECCQGDTLDSRILNALPTLRVWGLFNHSANMPGVPGNVLGPLRDHVTERKRGRRE